MNIASLISRSLVAVVLGAIGLTGCSSSTSDPSGSSGSSGSPETVGSACSSLCARDFACDSSVDKSVCNDKCMNTNASVLPKLRGDLVSAAINCFELRDCASVIDGSAWKACTQTAEASLAPSSAAQAFCASLVSTARKCDDTADEAKCLESSKIYNDAALTDASSCLANACSAVNDCITAALP
jgi:hypothetical protein